MAWVWQCLWSLAGPGIPGISRQEAAIMTCMQQEWMVCFDLVRPLQCSQATLVTMATTRRAQELGASSRHVWNVLHGGGHGCIQRCS